MKIELYYAPVTCAMAPYITLTEAGADFEVHALNFRTKDHLKPEYVKINPKHKVPMLIVDGQKLTENAAIHLWISRTFPDTNLIPAGPWEQAQAVSMLSWCSGGIHPYLSRINNPANVCDIDGTADSVVAHASDALYELFGLARFPNVVAHFERMQTRPSVQSLLAFEKETIEGFKKAAA